MRSIEHRASALRAPVVLRSGALRLSLDPDGSVRYLESSAERRLLFGRDELHFYKTQAGLLVQSQKQESRVTATPDEASFSSHVLDSVEVSQSIRLLPAPTLGYSRKVTIRNSGSSGVRVRVIHLQDPTTAHFRDRTYGWGAAAVNAFNRSSHVAMDEFAEPPAARVVGAQPPPSRFYMTTDRNKAQGFLQSGALPESSAGMSGQVLVLADHEFELQAAASVDIVFVSLYNPNKLEAALSDFGALFAAPAKQASDGPSVATSSGAVTSGSAWAKAGLEGAEYEDDLLDRFETLKGLAPLNPGASKTIIESARAIMNGDGSLPHSLDPWKPGVLETSVFLDGASRFAAMSGDKKYMRAIFPMLRRAANFLVARSVDGVVGLDGSLPQGWRRRIGRGYPTGELAEVSLAVAGGLSQAASLASRIGKAQDSAKFKERSVIISSSVKKRLLDDRGALALNLDEAGKLHADETVDQAVACYRYLFDRAVSASLTHRLLERDFEGGYGPRTIPTSNRISFNGSYGDGQLGGYWTRGALAHAVLAYESGFGGTGSLELEAVGRLASSDIVKFGGAPGDLPYWLDVERREAHGRGCDPVAASRFVESLVLGELGLSVGLEGVTLNPSVSSSLKWVLASNLWTGKRTSAFVGRAGGKTYAFASGAELRAENGWKFSGSEAAHPEDARLAAITFHGPGQVICTGNGSESALRTKVVFRPRDPELSKRLSIGLHELDPSSGSWQKAGTLKILPSMSFDIALGPGEWRAFRLSTG
ncbi:MAG: hypothetical protein LYZ69_03080 [Nitrososphaerales archaeon]|nr:hypothetical protein [Nitrososphaerales archaeon]